MPDTTDLTFHTELELDAGVVSYIDPDVTVAHDCKMTVREDEVHPWLTFSCPHGSFTFPFGELHFKEAP
jgi:hypothetical protein